MHSGLVSSASVFLVSVPGVGNHSPFGFHVAGFAESAPVGGGSLGGNVDMDGSYHPVPAGGIVALLELSVVGVLPTGRPVVLEASCGRWLHSELFADLGPPSPLDSCDWLGLDWIGPIGSTDVAERRDAVPQPPVAGSMCVEGAGRGVAAQPQSCPPGHGGLPDRFAVFRPSPLFSEAVRLPLVPPSVKVQYWYSQALSSSGVM